MTLTTEAKTLIGIGLVTVLILIGGVFFLTKNNPAKNVTDNTSDILYTENLVRQDSYQTASGSAKVVIVEFGDYQCPACKAASPSVEKLLSEYKNVNFVFRHFPLQQHKNAVLAAQVAEAAGKQGKYWQMHKKLYDLQDEWAENDSARTIFEKYATELGLDIALFKKDLDSGIAKDKIDRDKADGATNTVNVTPTFFINGKKYEGALSYEDFKTAVDKILSGN